MIRPLALGSVATTLATLLACSGGSSSTSDAPAPPPSADGPRDALVVASQSDLGVLNPIVYETASDAWVLDNMMWGLQDSEMDCSLEYSPLAATSWTHDEDGKGVTYQLRDDLTWSDGEPVTADDWVFTYGLIRNPAVASPRIASVAKMTDESPIAVDDHTLRFEFTTAYDRTTQMGHAGLAPMPEHVYADSDPSKLRGHPASQMPVVNGPWRLKLHEPNSRFVMEPNPAFTGPDDYTPQLKRVVFRVIPEYTTRLVELENGGVDIMESINIEDIDRLREDHPEIRIASRGYRTSDYVGWNTLNPLFADKDVRRALTMSIDIEGMIGKLLTGKDGTVYAKKSVSTVTPELCAVVADDVPLLPFDPEQAKAILAQNGWTDSDADGVLDKDGEPFRFTLSTNAGNKRRADASILIQADLKKVGIQVDLEKQESNSFFENLRKKEYDAALAGWAASLYIDPTAIWHSDTEERKYEFNFTSYSNPEVDALMEKGLQTSDPAEAVPLWKEVQAKIYEDQPYTFLWWREELVGIHDRFEDTTIDPLSLLNDLHEWNVSPENVKYAR